MKKYKLIKEKNSGLLRIKALRDIPKFGIKKGALGGLVASENNLSQEGNCWAGDDAQVSGNALVYGDARVYGDAQVFGDALVSGDAQVFGDALVSGNTKISKPTDCICISNLAYHITILPQHIQNRLSS